jgi:predicted dinucleotide-binding enzyme
MEITILGRGNVGGGLGTLWRKAGHSVTTLGREGGDAGDADVIVIAIPGGTLSQALPKVTGIVGKITIDATNMYGERDANFRSQSDEVKSHTHGPVAKAFNFNFAALYDQVAAQRVRPSMLFASDDDARSIAEQLIADAGYDPAYVGDLSRARDLEDLGWVLLAAGNGKPLFYRFASPGEL